MTARPTPGDDPLEHARRDALRLLEARARTRHELAVRLAKKGHAKDVIARLLDAFAQSELIDDEKVARAHARSILDRGARSEAWMRSALRRRGVAADLAAQVAKETAGARDALHDAMTLASRRLILAKRDEPPQATARRLVAFLARRGYDADTARKAVEQAMRRDFDEAQ